MVELQLSFGNQRARIARRGAALLGYATAGREFVDPGSADDSSAAFDGAVLAPWPGRLRDATWLHEGNVQQLPVNEARTGSALHGLVHAADWIPIERDPARILLGYRIHPQPGYPFELQLRAEYALSEAGLRCELTAVNVGRSAAPFGGGAHPYFGHAGTRVDAMTLQMSARTRLLVDERQLPAGRADVSGTDYDFSSARPLVGVELDTTFTDLERDAEGRSRVRLCIGGEPLEIWADDRFRWWQLYTSDLFGPDQPRYRRSLAVEPMTCPPDAFNSGEDLVWLAPEQSWRGRWGIVTGE